MGVREHLGRNMREHRAGLEKGNAKADSPEIGGRLQRHTEQALVRARKDVMSDDCGVLVRRGSGDGMGAKESCRNTGSPRKRSVKAQTGIPRGTGLACEGGGEARSSEDARNERRAKGPQFQGNATSGARAEIGASLQPPDKLWKLQETLHAQAKGVPSCVRKHEITLVRKPDAGNPHVRFDERGSGNGSVKEYRATPRLYLPSAATSCNSRSDGFQGQSSLRNAWSVTQYLSQDLTLFFQEPIARLSF